eukprot:COSAG06_NODE_10715_length_1630_cov_3.160679_1_plen_65_part_10
MAEGAAEGDQEKAMSSADEAALAPGRGGIPPENWLLLVSAWEYLSLMISTQASNQVWLDFYAGDY